MRVFGLWWGGANYAAPSVERDTEEFDSLRLAKHIFWNRANRNAYYPCVSGSSLQLFRTDPRESSDPYADCIITLGPRGGIRLEVC